MLLSVQYRHLAHSPEDGCEVCVTTLCIQIQVRVLTTNTSYSNLCLRFM